MMFGTITAPSAKASPSDAEVFFITEFIKVTNFQSYHHYNDSYWKVQVTVSAYW
ncbi:hypothetical protein [Streptococcus mutans]|uniref:hypothetical protein n=1 Tax=Streptococcus mutans TaxID=1309 RepID=UPI00138B047F|nr:hypothetical protein [Streptococcus mutans]MCB4943770.1 hypothetical protein [Streptococcus mutans]MCB5012009.1 hypothetical protein [Streptococcus mutans]QZS45203.1 hypothetical protein K2F51_09785 [Streptococcus mutans OMZ175]